MAGVTVTVGAAAGVPDAPHAARLIPAASAMAGIAITLLSFIVLPSPHYRKAHISLSVKTRLRNVHAGT
jgi:hypothetical protein